jgi:hypothetical protein
MDYPKLTNCPFCTSPVEITQRTDLDGIKRYFYLNILCQGTIAKSHCFARMDSHKRLYGNKFEEVDKKDTTQAAHELAERWNSRKGV